MRFSGRFEAVTAARNESPGSAIPLRRRGKICQLPTLWLIIDFTLNDFYLPRGLANRRAYHVQGELALKPGIMGWKPIWKNPYEEDINEDQSSCLICSTWSV